jgi:hypothetical protein
VTHPLIRTLADTAAELRDSNIRFDRLLEKQAAHRAAVAHHFNEHTRRVNEARWAKEAR